MSSPSVSCLVEESLKVFWASYTAVGQTVPLSEERLRRESGLNNIMYGSIDDREALHGTSEECYLLSNATPMAQWKSVPMVLQNIGTDYDAADVVQFTSPYTPLAFADVPDTTPIGMHLSSAVRLARAPAIFEMGDYTLGPGFMMPGNVTAAHWFANGELSSTSAAQCIDYALLFVNWLTRLVTLPSVRAVLSHLHRDAEGMLARCPLADAFRAVRMLHDKVGGIVTDAIEQYCTKVASVQKISPLNIHATKTMLNKLCSAYLKWRYLTAPLVIDGAKALLAYMCTSEPVLYTGLVMDVTSRGSFKTESKFYNVTGTVSRTGAPCASGANYYATMNYVIRVATQFDDVPVRTAKDTSPLAEVCMAVAHVMLQRSLALAHVATAFVRGKQRLGSVRDLGIFARHPDFMQAFRPDLHKALATAAAAPFGELGSTGTGSVCRRLTAPGINYAKLPDCPFTVTYRREEVCQFGSVFGKSLRTQLPRHFHRFQYDLLSERTVRDDERAAVVTPVVASSSSSAPLSTDPSYASVYPASCADENDADGNDGEDAPSSDDDDDGGGSDAAAPAKVHKGVPYAKRVIKEAKNARLIITNKTEWLQKGEAYALRFGVVCKHAAYRVSHDEQAAKSFLTGPPTNYLYLASAPCLSIPSPAKRPPACMQLKCSATNPSNVTDQIDRDTIKFFVSLYNVHCSAPPRDESNTAATAPDVRSSENGTKRLAPPKADAPGRKRLCVPDESGAAVSSSSSSSSASPAPVRQKAAARATTDNIVTMRHLIAAYAYYMSHCQEDEPAVAMTENTLNNLVTQVRAVVHKNDPETLKKRCTCHMDAKSPLTPIAIALRQKYGFAERAIRGDTAFLHTGEPEGGDAVMVDGDAVLKVIL